MSIDESTARSQVIKAGHTFINEGLIARTWGNISARISKDEFVITPSGLAYEDLRPEQLVVVRIADESYEGSIKPSSEKGVHAAMYKLHPDVDFIVHTHQNFATAVSITGDDIRGYDREYAKILGDVVPVAAYGISSTKLLRNNVRKASAKNTGSRAILMKNHGAVCLGTDYDEAFAVADALEKVAKIKYREYTTIDTDDMNGGKFSRLYSQYGKEMKAYLDDQVQMLGNKVRCLPANASREYIKSVILNEKAVFVTGKGAFVKGEDEDETEAVRLVIEKGSIAALLAMYVKGIKPLNRCIGIIEHQVYMKKYSKLKD